MDAFALIFIFTAIPAIACGINASMKNRNVIGWILLGVLLSYIALLVVICLSKLESTDSYSNGATNRNLRARQLATTKTCKFCGEMILKVAKKCKHCGEFTAEFARETRIESKNRNKINSYNQYGA